MNSITNDRLVSLFNTNEEVKKTSLQMVVKSGRLYLLNPSNVPMDKIDPILTAFHVQRASALASETELRLMEQVAESPIERGMLNELLKMMGGGKEPKSGQTEASISPLLQRFIEYPAQFYKEIQARRVEATFHGYDRNAFTFPEIAEAFQEMQRHIPEKTALLARSPFPLLQALRRNLNELEKELHSLEAGVQIVNDQGKVRTVAYPYEASITLCLNYLKLLDQIVRIERRMNQLLPEGERQAFYRDCESRVMQALRIDKIDGSDPDALKALYQMIDGELEQRDYAQAYQKLLQKSQGNESLQNKLKGLSKITPEDVKNQDIALHRLILKEMVLPPRFHSIRFEQHLKDVLSSDCILLPSFSPLDIPFFRKTGDAPVGLMGMVSDVIFGDEFLMTPYEFAIHDVNHFFDAIYQSYISMIEAGLSPLENLEIWEETKDFFQRKIDAIEDQELRSAVELVIFEVLHEEGHTYDLDNMRRGLEESNIYLNDLLDFLKKKIGELNFFQPPGSKPIISQEAQGKLEQARQTVSAWIRERAKQLGESPAGKLFRTEKEMAYTERRAKLKKITPDSMDYQFRVFSDNIKIVHKT